MIAKLKKSSFTILILICAIAYVITATRYGPQARLMPLIVGIPAIILSIIQLIFDMTGWEMKKAETKTKLDIPDEHSILGKASGAQTFAVFVSLTVFFGLIYLVGFMVAIPIFLFAFLIVIAKKKILRSFIFSAAMTSVIYVLFIKVLQAQLYKGIFFQ